MHLAEEYCGGCGENGRQGILLSQDPDDLLFVNRRGFMVHPVPR
jgi:hypothetical protein